ncbi:MAG TPA: HdeA/HdeB family chaperone [Pseudolabrys sp.]|nr:HdeA/HdeB family chaperone [Pseudolabrys sp.]
MNPMCMKILLGAGVFFSALGMLPAFAQDDSTRTVEQYTCKDILREHGTNRDVAVAFLHGFLLGKSGSSTFKVETLAKQTDEFIDRCIDTPQEKAVNVMMRVKG